MAGDCGLLRLEGDSFRVVDSEVGYGTIKDVAVDGDGTVWIAGIDQELQSLAGNVVTSHSFVATAVEVTPDGTVWAVRYDHPPGLSSLVSFDGTTFVEHEVGPVADEELVAAADGSLRTLALDPVDYDPETQSAATWHLLLGRMHDGRYTTEPIPEGFEGEHLTLAPDGALWAIGGTGRMIERDGYFTDTEWALIRYDGNDVTTIVIPFPEPNDVTVHRDGTVWVSSFLYGVFAYDGEEWVRYGVIEGLPDEEMTFVELGPNGSVYIGTRLGVTRIMPDGD